MTSSDGEWVVAVVRRYERPLLNYVGRFLGDADRARDIVQDAFLQLCKRQRGDLEPRMPAWLYVVCRNRVRSVLRKEKRMATLDDVVLEDRAALTPDPAGTAANQEEGQRVLMLLTKLPARSQEVVRLKFEHHLSYKEIGDVTGLTVGNVGFILHHALTKLRGLMETAGGASC